MTASLSKSRVRTDGAVWAPYSQDSTTVPRFSEGWFDDSGYTQVSEYTGPITDPDSLEQVKASRIGRVERAIAELRGLLGRLPTDDRSAAATAAELHLQIGACYMYEGEFAEARGEFQAAQAACPAHGGWEARRRCPLSACGL